MKPTHPAYWHFLDRWGRHAIAKIEVNADGELIALLAGNRDRFRLDHPVFHYWAGEAVQPRYGPDAPPAADVEAIRAGDIPNPTVPRA